MHTAGFELHLQRLHGQSCETWLQKIAEAPLECAPGEKVNYTCTAYFLLARVLEKLSGRRADFFIQEQLLAPLGIASNSGFMPSENYTPEQIAPTELKEDGTPWHGIVHDEAARQWQWETGGYCGNAGVFGTTGTLARFCAMWLNEGEGILHPDDVRRAFTDVQLENAEGAVYRGWGWQRDNKTYTGENAPPGCFGHQGFTGPTLFLNPQTKDVVIILNNRVYPTRNSPARFVYHRRIANLHFQEVSS
jgi:CubicO group peptidase (beta-lactamase class C family)